MIILSAEDDAEDTIRPRLEAAGADLDRIYLLQAIRGEDGNNGEIYTRGFSLVSDTDRLAGLIGKIGNVDLVVIDPITAYMGATDSHRNAEVRSLLAPLQALAQTLNPAVIAVSHLTKAQGVEALQRIQGSIAFAAAARAVWGVAKDKDNERRRLFLPLKNNLSTDESGYAFGLESFVLEGSEPPIATSHVMWESEKILTTADEAFSNLAKDFNDRTELDDAKEFLSGLLADGPLKSTDVEKNARGANHSMTTIRRAQRELKISPYREKFVGGWWWALPPR